MSNAERVRVLQMVAEGKVSPAEADEVLEALAPAPPAVPFTVPAAPKPGTMSGVNRQGPAGRTPRLALRIEVSEGEWSATVRVPSGLDHAQQDFLIRPVRKVLEMHDIDLGALVTFLDDIEQWPDGTALLDLSEDEFSVGVHVQVMNGA